MQIRHTAHILSRGGDKGEEQTQGEQRSASLGAFSSGLDGRPEAGRSWFGAKEVFRSLWYTSKMFWRYPIDIPSLLIAVPECSSSLLLQGQKNA